MAEIAEVPTGVVDDLAAQLDGPLVRAGDDGYDEARAIWNGMIDRRPALIAGCETVDDVVAAVDFARDTGLPLAVRGGGHGVAGQAVADGAVVIDLSGMRAVQVDADRRVVRAQGGCTLGDVDAATSPHGLAAPLGVVSKTGIAGLTLSGGMGWLRRRDGLSIDNLRAAEVVTADGRVLTADEREHPDLHWALRGGGGNFGVATAFEFDLHPVGPEVFACFVLYPAAQTREVLRGVERLLAQAPDDAAPIAVLGHVPELDELPTDVHGEPFAAVLAVHPGPAGDGERALTPLRELGDPIADLSGAMPWTGAQALLDEDYPDGGRYYWKSINVRELSDGVIDRLIERNDAARSPESTIDVWFQGGAMAAVGETETAFANRRGPYLIGVEGNWDDDVDSTANVAWVRATIDGMREFSDGGAYLNFPGFMEEGDALLRDGHGPNLERLVDVKTAYDPTNLFRLNANIAPRT